MARLTQIGRQAARILVVVTNVDHYANDPSHKTGLWLSELTHAYDAFADQGFEQTLISPAGGLSPLEPRSLRFPNFDKSARRWRNDPAKMARLDSTVAADIDSEGYDAIYFTGGQGVMDDFADHVEQLMLDHGARYSKARLPFVSNAVVDRNLLTGQNPGSAKETARLVVEALAARPVASR